MVECRRYTSSRQNQEQLGALAYRIGDTGASGGIIVTPLGLQEGASRIAKAENIVSVILTPESTTTDYFLHFLNQVFVGASEQLTFTETVKIEKFDERGNLVETRIA